MKIRPYGIYQVQKNWKKIFLNLSWECVVFVQQVYQTVYLEKIKNLPKCLIKIVETVKSVTFPVKIIILFFFFFSLISWFISQTKTRRTISKKTYLNLLVSGTRELRHKLIPLSYLRQIIVH